MRTIGKREEEILKEKKDTLYPEQYQLIVDQIVARDQKVCMRCIWWAQTEKEMGECRFPPPPWPSTLAWRWCSHFETYQGPGAICP